MKRNPKTFNPHAAADACFEALRSARCHANLPNAHRRALSDSLHEIKGDLVRMLDYAPVRDGGDDLRRLIERIDQICEYANMMECGALSIQIEQALTAAYRRMP